MANGDGGFDVPAGTVVMETAVDMQGIDRGLREVEKRGQEAGEAAGEGFGAGFGETVGEDGAQSAADRLDQIFEDTGDKAEQAGGKVKSADEKIDDLGETAETTSQTTGGLALILGEKLASGATRATTKVVGLAEIGLGLLADGVENLGIQLQDASDDWQHFNATGEAAGRILEDVGRTVETVSHKLTALRVAIAGAIATGFATSIRQADKFERSFNRIETLLPDTAENVDSLRVRLSDMAAQTRVSADTVNKTYFKALSRMPRLAEDTETALEVVRTAVEAQSTGFVDAEDAVAAYEAVLQGFQREAHDAEEVSDLLFKAQERAGVQFDRIAASVGDVASITNALEGEFEDLLSVYATLVPTGQSVSEVNTQLRGVIQGIINPSQQAKEAQKELGLELDAQKVRSQGLLETMREVIEATDGNPEQIAELFGSQEAVTLLVTLASRMDKLRREQEEFADATGTHADVVDEMGDSMKDVAGDIGGDFLAILRQFGNLAGKGPLRLLQIFKGITATLREANRALTTWLKGVQDVDREAPRLPFDIDPSAISLQQLRAIRDLQFELGLIDEERFRELEKEYGQAGREAGEAFAEGVAKGVDAQEEQAFAAMEGIQAALREERRQRIREGRQLREPPDIPTPELPADPQVVEERARAIRRVGRVRAQMARMAGEEESAVQSILQENQARLNDFVEAQLERLRNYDVEQEKLSAIADMWENVEVSTEGVRKVTDETARAIEERMADTVSRIEENFREGLDIEPPDLGLDENQELTEFEQNLRIARRRIEKLANEGELSFENVKGVLEDTNISLQDLEAAGSSAFAALVRMAIKYREEQEKGNEETEKIAETLSKIGAVADGVLQAADAMGALDDETRQALNAVRGLVQAGSQIASGNLVAGISQGIGSLGNLIASFIGPSEREKELRELRQSLDELRSSIDRMRSVFREFSGEQIFAAREALDEFFDTFEGRFGNVPGFDKPQMQSLRGQLELAGLSMEELIAIGESLGLELDDLKKAARGADVSSSQLRDELQKLQDSLQTLRLEKVLNSFRGQMNLLQTELELFDVEDPIEELRRVLDIFNEFTDLPPAFQRLGEKFDLESAAGRRLFEQQIQQMFRRLRQGTMPISEFGDLTPQQFQNLLERMEGLLDEADQQQGGTSQDFQVSRQITEITASKMIGVLSTLSTQAVQRNQLLARMLRQMGGSVPQSIRPPRPAAVGGGGTTVNRRETRNLNLGGVNVLIEGGGDGKLTRQDGRRAAQGFVEELDRRLASREDEKTLRGGG